MDIISLEKPDPQISADVRIKRITAIRVVHDGEMPFQKPGYVIALRNPDSSVSITVDPGMRFAYQQDGEILGDASVWLLFEYDEEDL